MNKATGFCAQLDKVSVKGEQKLCLTSFPLSSFRHYSECDSQKTETPRVPGYPLQSIICPHVFKHVMKPVIKRRKAGLAAELGVGGAGGGSRVPGARILSLRLRHPCPWKM